MTRQRTRPFLPYAGLPVICAALPIASAGQSGAAALLRFEALAVFGYIASVYDIKERRIPNLCVLLMIGAWTAMVVPQLFYDTSGALSELIDSAMGFASAGALFLLVYLVSRKGLGGGDVKFMAAAGLYLGFQRVPPAILYGSILSAIVGGILILAKRIGRKDPIPLAPFLYIGILLTIFLR
jgi:prepilin signal peptidase PulO-like enzyme (type II secretory pathway)